MHFSLFWCAGARRSGLPQDWATVENWATSEPPFFTFFQPETSNHGLNKIQGKEQPDSF
jgi:hypothetical protein